MTTGVPVTQKLFFAWFSSTLAVSFPPLPSTVHCASIGSPVDLIGSNGSLQPGMKAMGLAAPCVAVVVEGAVVFLARFTAAGGAARASRKNAGGALPAPLFFFVAAGG